MATGVLCSAIQLSQQPSPHVHLPADRVALPNPIPSQHVPRRTAKPESHGGFRWHRPAFQPFQLKPWVRDPDVEEEMRKSLAVMGPRSKAGMIRAHRSLTAPPITVSSVEARRGGERKNIPKTAGSSRSLRELLTPVTKRSVATFPARPPISKGKQIPGRFFPKPTLTEGQKAQLEMIKLPKPRKAYSLHSAAPSRDTNRVNVLDSSAGESRADRQHSSSANQLIASKVRQQLQKERPELRSEVFAICFKQDLGSTAYDPHSELHSDYYSIQRLKMPPTRALPNHQPVKDNNNSSDDFAVVLRGQRKHLHKKLLLSAESVESLVESLVQPARSGVSLTKRTLLDDKVSPLKVIDIETPKADEQSDEQSDASEADQEPDNTLAPLNSPTDQRDAFPALV